MHEGNKCRVNNLMLHMLIWHVMLKQSCALRRIPPLTWVKTPWSYTVGFGCRKRPSLLDLAAGKSHPAPTLSAPKVKIWRLGLLINKHKQSVMYISIEYRNVNTGLTVLYRETLNWLFGEGDTHRMAWHYHLEIRKWKCQHFPLPFVRVNVKVPFSNSV